MNKMYERVEKCLDYVRSVTDFVPETAVVLGSGLGAFADGIDTKAVINYSDIPDFPRSTVLGHKGRFVFGYASGVPVAVMQGRVHFYEGYSQEECVLPLRLLHLMGAKKLILTNASGGINKNFGAGDFMVIDDHISLFVRNPLIGENIDEFGTRFPDMSCVYDSKMRDAIDRAGEKLGIPLRHGVYVQLTGPSYECPAEIRMLSAMGADAVGMSTVSEAIAAKHMGMRICGISCVSNLAAGISDHPLSHSEVFEAMNAAAEKFCGLMLEVIRNVHELDD